MEERGATSNPRRSERIKNKTWEQSTKAHKIIQAFMSLGALAMPTHVYAKPGISIQY
jgi:hypothetical protein